MVCSPGSAPARPLLRFLEKDPQVRPGDVVVDLPRQHPGAPEPARGGDPVVDDTADPAPEAVVQLIAPIAALDWVQVQVR